MNSKVITVDQLLDSVRRAIELTNDVARMTVTALDEMDTKKQNASTALTTTKVSTMIANAIHVPLPISEGGTGATTAEDAIKELIGGLSDISGSKKLSATYLPYYEINDATTNVLPVGKVPLSTVLYYCNNRQSSVASSNTAYTTYMGRGIALVTAAPASMTNGTIALIYS